MDLRARLLAARGMQAEVPAETQPVAEPSYRSLTTEEQSLVDEVSQGVPQEVQITDAEQNDINEMFSDILSGASVVESEDEYEEDDEEDEIVSESMPEIPEPAPVPEITAEHTRVFSEVTSRFSGAMWYEDVAGQNVTIVGVGGIGSWTALLISRLGVNQIILYDDDVVEIGNMSGQFYCMEDIDKTKVDSIAWAVRNYSEYLNVTSFPEKLTASTTTPVSPVVIACLDSMQARKTVFNKWKSMVLSADDRSKYLFIDGRLAAETLQVYAVAGSSDADIRRYEQTLFSDDEADSEICSYKQTSFMANMIASVITNVFVNYVASKLDGGAAREIPFKTEYLGEMMWFKTEA